MKKIALALMLSLGVTSVFAETRCISKVDSNDRCLHLKGSLTLPPLPDVDNTQFKIDFKFTKDGQVITSGDVSTLNGVPSNIGIGTEHTYLADIQKVNGDYVLTPGTIFSGLYALFTPTFSKDKTQVILDVHFTKVFLDSMNIIKTPNGDIQKPEITKINADQVLTVDFDKAIEFPLVSTIETNHQINKPIDTLSSYKIILTVKKGS